MQLRWRAAGGCGRGVEFHGGADGVAVVPPLGWDGGLLRPEGGGEGGRFGAGVDGEEGGHADGAGHRVSWWAWLVAPVVGLVAALAWRPGR